ncbi:MAG TPA: hypothetical protein VNG71_13860 [Pyrinomonadaceae bacterium]|nr:hypothetical protein [Pyrinomonadaceae bacterium]
MSFFAKFRRQKEDPEVARRALLMKSGRIGEATILDSDVDADGQTLLSYCYTVGSVDYETVQHLDAEQLTRKDCYLPGSRVDLRYDPRRPANSLVV